MDEYRVTDTEALKAIAHPLRTKMLALLRYEGPATASELARRVEETSGSTSYHLRQLAKYGYIEEDPEQPNKRDRRWRAAHQVTSYHHSDFAGDPEGSELRDALARRMAMRALDLHQRWQAGRDRLDPRWLDISGGYDNLLQLTPSQLDALEQELFALVTRYRTDPPPPRAGEPVAHVAINAQFLPFEEIPL